MVYYREGGGGYTVYLDTRSGTSSAAGHNKTNGCRSNAVVDASMELKERRTYLKLQRQEIACTLCFKVEMNISCHLNFI